MTENQPSDSELDRLQRELLVFLTHRLAEAGLEGQPGAVSLNRAVVDAIARQHDAAARAAAAEVDRQLSSGLAALNGRFDRLERRLDVGGQTAAIGQPAALGKPATGRGPVAQFEPAPIAPGGPLAPVDDRQARAETEDPAEDSRPARARRAIGVLPIVAIVIMALAIAALVYGLVVTAGERDAARSAQRAQANNQEAFCTMAGEAIRALPPADAAATTPAGPPEQERLARAAAELCGNGN